MGYNAFDFSGLRQKPLSGDPDRAHPVMAPVAWVLTLLAGAAFWVAVFRVVF